MEEGAPLAAHSSQVREDAAHAPAVLVQLAEAGALPPPAHRRGGLRLVLCHKRRKVNWGARRDMEEEGQHTPGHGRLTRKGRS